MYLEMLRETVQTLEKKTLQSLDESKEVVVQYQLDWLKKNYKQRALQPCSMVAVTRPDFTLDFHPMKLLLLYHNFIIFIILLPITLLLLNLQ